MTFLLNRTNCIQCNADLEANAPLFDISYGSCFAKGVPICSKCAEQARGDEQFALTIVARLIGLQEVAKNYPDCVLTSRPSKPEGGA